MSANSILRRHFCRENAAYARRQERRKMKDLISRLYALAPRFKAASLHDDLVTMLDAAPEWIHPLLAALLSLWHWEQNEYIEDGPWSFWTLGCGSRIRAFSATSEYEDALSGNSTPLIAKLEALVEREVEALWKHKGPVNKVKITQMFDSMIIDTIKTALTAAPPVKYGSGK